LEASFGGVPAPAKPLHVVHVTKTLINEFWQDVAAGMQDEAAKYEGIIDDARTPGASTYRPDQVSIGAKAADFLAARFPEGGAVAQIEGAAGSPNACMRIQGFVAQLKTYPNLQLVAMQPGNWDRMTAMNATSTILRDNPSLVGVYTNNDGMALGVYGLVAYSCRSECSFRPPGVRRPRGFFLPMLNADGVGYRSR
jgi:ribose transport system substrate-binding protein